MIVFMSRPPCVAAFDKEYRRSPRDGSRDANFSPRGRRNFVETLFDGGRISFMASKAGRPVLPSDAIANQAMARYADGDASAFPVLYDAIAPRIEGFVKRRTSDASRIDDIVQQTFERIHRARGTFIRGSDVLSWAFAIARNLCLDFGTQGWREHVVDGDDAADPLMAAVAEVADAERVAIARESMAQLVRAFRRLPVAQQLALELVRVEGFSMAAAAHNLGVTLASLKMSLFRAAAGLRAALGVGNEKSLRRRLGPLASLDKEPLHGVT
jgi:RNA polymerase sigma-70 factor (ECF subfamily)